MKINCPHCGQHYEIEDSAVGMTATCMTCQKNFTLSATPPEPPQPRAADNPPPTITRCPFCNMVKKHRILIAIGIALLALVVFSICRDCYLKSEAKKVHERAEKAAKEAEDAIQKYRRTESSGKRLQELEKIYMLRGFTDSEKKEAKDLLDYMQKRAEENGYDEGKRLFIKLRRQWRLE